MVKIYLICVLHTAHNHNQTHTRTHSAHSFCPLRSGPIKELSIGNPKHVAFFLLIVVAALFVTKLGIHMVQSNRVVRTQTHTKSYTRLFSALYLVWWSVIHISSYVCVSIGQQQIFVAIWTTTDASPQILSKYCVTYTAFFTNITLLCHHNLPFREWMHVWHK